MCYWNFISEQKMKVNFALFTLILLMSVERTKNQSVKFEPENVTTVFVQRIVEDFGSNGTIGLIELDDFLPSEYRDFSSCLMNVTTTQSLTACLEKKCISARDIFQLYSFALSHELTFQDVQELSPALLYSMMKTDCGQTKSNNTSHDEGRVRPQPLAVWGFGFLFVTVISLCSLIGVIVLPCMKRSIYRLVLVYMVALAVGSLAGSGLLFLIPEAFGLVGQDDHMGYIWKATAIMGGIYLFYLTERIMRILVTWRERKMKKGHIQDNMDDGSDGLMNVICSVKKKTPEGENAKIYKEPNSMPRNISMCTGQELLEDNSDDSIDAIGSRSNQKMLEEERTSCKNEKNQMMNGEVRYELGETKKTIKPVAWMIIFGDGLHNFIDGLSIGAAFTENILTGISVSMAVICEELPHELGDFAILLNSGMSLKKALLFNFLSACMCFLGLVFGILLGDMTGAHHYVFGVAGGMFLYISLADMMPEMNAAETTNDKSLGTVTIFILQNLGLLSGYGIMLVMAVYSTEIKF
ncbi:metal cation symporter ZIP14-like isoform X2 [Gigantopelta aegis]|uniref:metal cation symporter ZIP14-like isoform X2 n=1 Tax=Gigantopelta aegis TaxID=1735272 RepID=UPI001B88B391|nr:metal cation symporter ZIP14-like isoform X2 [Gigantopelta aegis]